MSRSALVGVAILVVARLADASSCPWSNTLNGLDCSGLSKAAGLEQFIEYMKQGYPYTEHRGLDWDALGQKYVGLVREAGDDNFKYYEAVRSLVADMKDGHVSADYTCADTTLERAQAVLAGSYGVELRRDEKGAARVVSAEEGVDLKPEETVVEVCEAAGCESINEHLKKIKLTWDGNSVPACSEARENDRLILFNRAKLGSKLHLRVLGVDGKEGSRTLEAEAGDDPVWQNYYHTMPGKAKECVKSKYMPDADVLYLQVGSFAGKSCSLGFGSKIRAAVRDAKSKKAKGMVVDLRGNGGGLDALVPKLLGFFANEEYIYEQAAVQKSLFKKCALCRGWLNKGSKRIKGVSIVEYKVKPEARAERFDGPVAVLVNQGTMSNGEMTAGSFQKKLGATVVGFQGTAGSASMAGGKFQLPCIRIGFTVAQSWTPDDKIQVEGGKGCKAGVVPDKPVPKSMRNLLKYSKFLLTRAVQEDVELIYALHVLKTAAERATTKERASKEKDKKERAVKEKERATKERATKEKERATKERAVKENERAMKEKDKKESAVKELEKERTVKEKERAKKERALKENEKAGEEEESEHPDNEGGDSYEPEESSGTDDSDDPHNEEDLLLQRDRLVPELDYMY